MSNLYLTHSKNMKHLLIDFENIQPQNLDKLSADGAHIWLFLGVIHKSLPVGLVRSLLRFGERAHLVQLRKSGKNALDFYLSYYLGRIAATDPEAQIGVLSRDSGYDILVEHILENQQAQSIVRLVNIEEVQYQKLTATPPATLLENNPQLEVAPKSQQSLAPYFRAALTALRSPDIFLPGCLHDLKKNLADHVLQGLMMEKADDERERLAQVIINNFKAKNLISIDEQETVSYYIDDNALLQKIQRYILHTKPKTYADFQSAVQNRADAFCLGVEPGDIQAFAQHLSERNLIRQNNGEIEYAPFAETKPQPVAKQTVKTVWQLDKTMWEKVITLLSAAKTNRPATVNALRNAIKSYAKSDEKETEELLQHLQDTKFLRIDGTKIVYLKPGNLV